MSAWKVELGIERVRSVRTVRRNKRSGSVWARITLDVLLVCPI